MIGIFCIFIRSSPRRCSGGDCESGTSGTIKSPNHPLNYPVDQHVTYPLMVAEGKAIELTFTSMDIEECTDPDFGGKCYCDYVEVLDSDGSQLFKECNSEIPSPLTNTGNTMLIVFHSDYSVNQRIRKLPDLLRWWRVRPSHRQ